MIRILGKKRYKNDKQVVYYEADFFSNYDLQLASSNTVNYRFFYDKEYTLSELQFLLEEMTDETIFFNSVAIMTVIITPEIAKKNIILAPFSWKRANRSQANTVLNFVDYYATPELLDMDYNYSKNKKNIKSIPDGEQPSQLTKKVYVFGAQLVDTGVEISFAIHEFFNIEHLRISSNQHQIKINSSSRLQTDIGFDNLVSYRMIIDSDQYQELEASYLNGKLKFVHIDNLTRNKINLYKINAKQYFEISNKKLYYHPHLDQTEYRTKEKLYLDNIADCEVIKTRNKIVANYTQADKIVVALQDGEDNEQLLAFLAFLKKKRTSNIVMLVEKDSKIDVGQYRKVFTIGEIGSKQHLIALYHAKLILTNSNERFFYQYFDDSNLHYYNDLIVASVINFNRETMHSTLKMQLSISDSVYEQLIYLDNKPKNKPLFKYIYKTFIKKQVIGE